MENTIADWFFESKLNRIREIIKNPSLMESEEIRINMMKRKIAEQELNYMVEVSRDTRKKLIKRNSRKKFYEKYPGGDYDKMIEGKVLKKTNSFEQKKLWFRLREKEEEKKIKNIKKKGWKVKLRKDFGRRIKNLREGKSRSIATLSKKSKLDRGNLYKIENGVNNVSLENIISFAKSFNLYVYELLEFNLKNQEEKTREEIVEIEFKEKLGIKIKNERLKEERKRTQKKLSAKSTLNRAYIAKVEKGKGNISLENIGKIAIAFNIHIHLLMRVD